MNLTDQLADLLADEPPYALDPEPALAAGRRRRARRTAAVTGALTLTSGVVIASVVLGQGSAPVDRLQVGSAPTAPTADAGGTSSPYYRVVRQHTPAAWVISHAYGEGGGWQADVDDGTGAGRLSIGVSPHPGSLQQHPCGDPEFAQGASCVESMLDPDTRLVVRGLQPTGAFRDLSVVIVHADGGGVDVEADNATWPDPPASGVMLTAAEKNHYATGTVNRPAPAYSTDQLVAIARALDAATSAP